jgi:tetratricopeptide (TPR) repeat protein
MRILFCTLLLIAPGLHSGAQDTKKGTAAYYFEKGEQSLEKKEYISAHAHFNECLRLDPHFVEAYRLRGIVREHLGEKAKALTDYNVYVSLKPKDAEGLFSRAVLRFESNQFLLARQDFVQLLSMPPGETNMVFFSQEKYDPGSSKVFTAQSGSRDYLFNYLGVIETKLERYKQAIVWLDSAIKLAPNVSNYWVNRGQAKQQLKNSAGAAADYEQALILDPENSLALHNLATLKSEAGENTASNQLLTEAIEKNKGLPYPIAERAFQRFQRNDLKGALEDYNELIRLEPDDENYVNRALVKERMKDTQGAMSDFSKAILINDKNEKAWLGHGNVMMKGRRWKEAIEDYSVAIKIDPKYALAYYNRAIAYQGSGALAEGCLDLRMAEELSLKVDPKMKGKICR